MSFPAWTPTKALAARACETKIQLLPLPKSLARRNRHDRAAIPLHAFNRPRRTWHCGRPPARPQRHRPSPRPPRRLHTLTITRDGKFFFSSTGGTYQTGISLEELAPRLRDATKNGLSKELYLDADARCRYSDVEIAVDQLSAAGITNLVILTENPPTPKTQTQ